MEPAQADQQVIEDSSPTPAVADDAVIAGQTSSVSSQETEAPSKSAPETATGAEANEVAGQRSSFPAGASDAPDTSNVELPTEPDSLDLQWHGFVSQGFMLSSGNNYLTDSTSGSFEFAEAALNVSAALTSTLATSMQVFARDLGPIGNYSLKLDWFQLDWHPVDQLGLRAGRIRMPFGLYNDISDYDPARLSILLPQSLYPATSRDFLLAVTGGELYGALALGGAGYLEYSAYGGAIYIDTQGSTLPIEVNVPYTVGARLMWETPLLGLRAGGSLMALKLEGSVADTTYELPAVLGVVSTEYEIGILLVAVEYGRWHTDLRSSDDMVIQSEKAESERYYVLTGLVLTDWLQLGAYYSGLFGDVETRKDSTEYQHDVCATVRLDLNRYWLLKVEAHYMHGTGDVKDNLNPTPAEDRPNDWALTLVKTTAYF